MSQMSPPMSIQPPATNGVGLAGFICSLIGLISCGLLSPVGLVLSIVGMSREPKGFAIAGLVLGILGSIWVVIAFAFGLFAIVLGAIGIGAAAPFIMSTAEMTVLSGAVETYRTENKALPTSLDKLPGQTTDSLTDAWGSPYVLTPGPDGTSFTIASSGPDKTPGTGDDFTATSSR